MNHKLIDHTLLAPTSSRRDIARMIEEGKENGFASICIHPCWVSYVAQGLKGSGVKVCTVVGFPLGANTASSKIAEAKEAVENGADEIDMVVNIGLIKSGEFAAVTEEIKGVKEVIGDRVLKVIVETCYLTEEEKIKVCKCVEEGRADYIKTSTGFGSGGAVLSDILLFRKCLKNGTKIKASGGIRTKEDFEAFVNAGCDRIGTSCGISFVSNE